MKRHISDINLFYLIFGRPTASEMEEATEDDVRHEAETMREEGTDWTEDEIEAAVRGLRELQSGS